METKVCKKCGTEKELNKYKIIHNKYYSNICKECIAFQSREYYKNHKKQHNETVKKYYEKNKEKIDNYRKEWETKNKEHILKKHREYYKKRNKYDNLFRLKHQIRTSVLNSFKDKNFIKNSKIKNILKCDWQTFYNYLLQTFKDNYGYEWNGKEPIHIDHIIPLDTAKNKKDILKLNYYKNLQLLKPIDNLKKKNKINWKLEKGEKKDGM